MKRKLYNNLLKWKIESIRNAKIYNSIPVQLGKENKKFKYSLVEKSARAREYESSLNWIISSNMIIKCNSVKIQQSPLKASDNVTSKSLNYYIDRYKPKYSIRISSKNFGFNNNIKSIPLYA